MDGLVAGRGPDWGRHERISSKDRGSGGAEAGAWSIDLCDAALFGDIAGKEAALSCRTDAGAEVGDNVRKMETLVGGVGGGRLGGRIVVAGGAGSTRTRFKLGRSHGDEDGQKHK